MFKRTLALTFALLVASVSGCRDVDDEMQYLNTYGICQQQNVCRFDSNLDLGDSYETFNGAEVVMSDEPSVAEANAAETLCSMFNCSGIFHSYDRPNPWAAGTSILVGTYNSGNQALNEALVYTDCRAAQPVAYGRDWSSAKESLVVVSPDTEGLEVLANRFDPGSSKLNGKTVVTLSDLACP